MSKRTATTHTLDEYGMDREKLAEETRRGPSYWRPKDKTNNIRILFLKGRGSFFLRAIQHFNVGPDRHTTFCPAEMESKPCVACNVYHELRRSPDPDDKQLAKDMRPKEQFFVAMVDLTAPQNGVQIYPFGSMVMDQLMIVVKNPDWGHPFHPLEGRNFQIEKTQTGPDKFNVKYTVFPAAKPSAIADMAWELDALDTIDEVVKFTPQDQVKAWLDGYNEEDEEDPEPTMLRRPVTQPVRATKQVIQEPEVDEDELPFDEEDEEEDEYVQTATVPVRSSRSTTPPSAPSGKVPVAAADRLRSRLAEIGSRKA